MNHRDRPDLAISLPPNNRGPPGDSPRSPRRSIGAYNFKLPKALHGALIGKGGSTVRDIQDQYSVRLIIPGRDDPAENIIIEGPIKAVSSAINRIEGLVGRPIEFQAARSSAPSSPRLSERWSSGDPVETVRLSVPEKFHHLLVGPGGISINTLQAENGVVIRVPDKDEAAALNNSAVIVSGPREKIQAAIEAMEALTHFRPSSAPLIVQKLAVPQGSHNIIVGQKGVTLLDLERRFNCAILIPKREENSGCLSVQSDRLENLVKLKEEMEKLIKQSIAVLSSAEEERVQRPHLDLSGSLIAEVLFFPDYLNEAEAEADKPEENQEKPASQGLFKSFMAKLRAPQKCEETPFLTAPPSLSRTRSGSFVKVSFVFERFLLYLSSAQRTLDIAVFTITDDRVSQIIAEMHESGVKVRILTEAKTANDEGSDIALFKRLGIPVQKRSNAPFLFHHKFAVLDGVCLINGSFNWTRAASNGNCENLIISNRPELVQPFHKQFQKLWAEGEQEEKNNNNR